MIFNYKETPIQIKKLREVLKDEVDNKYYNIFDICGIERTKKNEASVFKNIIFAASPGKNKPKKETPLDKYSWLILKIMTYDFKDSKFYKNGSKKEINSALKKILDIESTYIFITGATIQVGYYFPNSPDNNTTKTSKYTLFNFIREAIQSKVSKELKCACPVYIFKEDFIDPYKHKNFKFYGNYFELRSFRKLYDDYADEKRPYELVKGVKQSIYSIAGNRHLDKDAYKWVVYMLQSEAGKKIGSKNTKEELLARSKIGNETNKNNSLKKIRAAISKMIEKKDLNFTAYNIHIVSESLNKGQESTPISIKTASKYLKSGIVHKIYNEIKRWECSKFCVSLI